MHAQARTRFDKHAYWERKHAHGSINMHIGSASMQDAHKGRPYYGRWLVLFARVSRKSDVNLPGWMDGRWDPGQVPCPIHQAGCACFYAEHVPTHPTPVHSRDAACPRPACLPACCYAEHVPTHPTPVHSRDAACPRPACLLACFYAEHVPTHPTPVHSRDAACPRPACLPACFYAEHVPTHPTPVHSRDAACPRPACLPACFYAEHVPTHPTPVHSRDAACPRPACLRATCAITHPTRRCASCMLTSVLYHHTPHALARILHACMRPTGYATPRVGMFVSGCVLRDMPSNGPNCVHPCTLTHSARLFRLCLRTFQPRIPHYQGEQPEEQEEPAHESTRPKSGRPSS